MAFVAQSCSWDVLVCRHQPVLKGLVWPRGFVILVMHKRIDSHSIYRLGAAEQMLAGISEGYQEKKKYQNIIIKYLLTQKFHCWQEVGAWISQQRTLL